MHVDLVGVVTELRKAIFLLVALARSVVLPQGAAVEAGLLHRNGKVQLCGSTHVIPNANVLSHIITLWVLTPAGVRKYAVSFQV